VFFEATDPQDYYLWFRSFRAFSFFADPLQTGRPYRACFKNGSFTTDRSLLRSSEPPSEIALPNSAFHIRRKDHKELYLLFIPELLPKSNSPISFISRLSFFIDSLQTGRPYRAYFKNGSFTTDRSLLRSSELPSEIALPKSNFRPPPLSHSIFIAVFRSGVL